MKHGMARGCASAGRSEDSPQLPLLRRFVQTSAAMFLPLLAFLSLASGPLAHAQGLPTATRLGDLQVGAGFTFAHSDYNFTPLKLMGEAAYASFDLRSHWGAEFDFHNVDSTQGRSVYERTYEIGPRVLLHRGRIAPYAKVLFGRGVYNFDYSAANVAYNIYTFGGGVDFSLTRSINLRGDYEYQSWMGFPLGNLHPNVATIGVAYHFHE